MARVKLSKELKAAITGLSHKEKDRLLFRLIAKDPALVAQLNFELLEKEAGVTKEDHRIVLEKAIISHLENYDPHYYSPGYLLLELRQLSGDINRHVRTTKDKYGDTYLNFLMLNHTFRLYGDRIRQSAPSRAMTFNEYVVKRALRLLKQLRSMHEDHVLDFEEAMKELGEHIGSQPNTMRVAIHNMLDVNHLLKANVHGE